MIIKYSFIFLEPNSEKQLFFRVKKDGIGYIQNLQLKYKSVYPGYNTKVTGLPL